MTDHKDRPPAFELQAAARAREITFHEVGDVTWRTANTGHVERTGQREGLPSPIPPQDQARTPAPPDLGPRVRA